MAEKEHKSRAKESWITAMSQVPLGLSWKAGKWLFFLIIAIALYSTGKDYLKEYRAEAEKAKAEGIVRGPTSSARNQMEFWVTADSPSCFKSPRGDIFIGLVGEGRDLKRIGPDGTVTHIGPNKTETSPNLKEGDVVCFQLEDGGKPAKMRVVAM